MLRQPPHSSFASWLGVLGCGLVGTGLLGSPIVKHRPDAPKLQTAAPSVQRVALRSAVEAEATDHDFLAEVTNGTASRSALATRFASLSSAQCRAELKKRQIATSAVRQATPGIATPVRLAGPLQGIRFVTPGARSKYGVLDCRLALILDELARTVKPFDVVEVRIDNFYRPHAHLPGRKKPSQHALGLAADIVGFTLANGRTLNVERDWHGMLGAPACGPDSEPIDPTEETIALRNVVCKVARAGLFHHLLTPNFDEAHDNHVHADIKRGDRRVGVR